MASSAGGPRRFFQSAQQVAKSIVRSLPGNQWWNDLADDLGLKSEVSFGSPRKMFGYIEGIRVWIGEQNGSSSYTVQYELEYAAVTPPLRIRSDEPAPNAAHVRPGADIEIGDPLLDEQLVMQSDYPAMLIDFLTPARRAALTRLFDAHRDCLLVNNTITVVWRSAHSTPPNSLPNIAADARELVDIAKILQGNAASDHAAPSDMPPMMPAERRAEPAPSKKKPQRTTPAQLEQQRVIDDLFDGSRARYDAIEQFAEQYEGKQIQWRGEVERFSPYRSDTDFGEGPGIKAVVVVGAPGRSQLISAEVRAVVQLPSTVALRNGNVISFSGTLRRVDRFARQIYVTDAALSSGR